MEKFKKLLKGEGYINSPIEKVWELWIDPEHIKH
jgi:uncharacterized protein YndB with AHSA1/START domain